METKHDPLRSPAAARQRGQTVFLAAVFLLFGVTAAIYAALDTTSVSLANRQSEETAKILALARDALIGRSASDANRPGSLPCPDTDDDGVAEIFVGSNCPSYIGRLPWRTLGLPDLRDPYGERLWYMLSSTFRDHSTAEPINSDTKGNIRVYIGDNTNILTNEAVAVIFAPGAALGTQIRDVANKNNAANYLESASGINNASATGPYISTQPTAIFNDRLIVVTTAELMTRVEQRVAREIRSLLQAYKANSGSIFLGCNCYPWPDISNGTSNLLTDAGRVPLLGALPHSWASLGITVPSWLINNEWWWVIFYAVAPSLLEIVSFGTLTVDGNSGYGVVLITTGPAGAGRPISSGSWSDPTSWTSYIDDNNNSDMGTNFITPSSTAYARNRLYAIP